MEQGSEEEAVEEVEEEPGVAAASFTSPELKPTTTNGLFSQPGRHGGETSDGPFAAAGRRPEQLLSRF